MQVIEESCEFKINLLIHNAVSCSIVYCEHKNKLGDNISFKKQKHGNTWLRHNFKNNKCSMMNFSLSHLAYSTEMICFK